MDSGRRSSKRLASTKKVEKEDVKNQKRMTDLSLKTSVLRKAEILKRYQPWKSGIEVSVDYQMSDQEWNRFVERLVLMDEFLTREGTTGSKKERELLEEMLTKMTHESIGNSFEEFKESFKMLQEIEADKILSKEKRESLGENSVAENFQIVQRLRILKTLNPWKGCASEEKTHPTAVWVALERLNVDEEVLKHSNEKWESFLKRARMLQNLLSVPNLSELSVCVHIVSFVKDGRGSLEYLERWNEKILDFLKFRGEPRIYNKFDLFAQTGNNVYLDAVKLECSLLQDTILSKEKIDVLAEVTIENFAKMSRIAERLQLLKELSPWKQYKYRDTTNVLLVDEEVTKYSDEQWDLFVERVCLVQDILSMQNLAQFRLYSSLVSFLRGGEGSLEYFRKWNDTFPEYQKYRPHFGGWRSEWFDVPRVFEKFDQFARTGDDVYIKGVKTLLSQVQSIVIVNKSAWNSCLKQKTRILHCQTSCLSFLACFKFPGSDSILKHLPKDIVLLIAKMVWNTRIDSIWGLCTDDKGSEELITWDFWNSMNQQKIEYKIDWTTLQIV